MHVFQLGVNAMNSISYENVNSLDGEIRYLMAHEAGD